jgi:hypothetical protein
MDCHPSRTPNLHFADIICSMEIVDEVTNHMAKSTAAVVQLLT